MPTVHIVFPTNVSQEDAAFTFIYPKGMPVRKIYHIFQVPAIDLR